MHGPIIRLRGKVTHRSDLFFVAVIDLRKDCARCGEKMVFAAADSHHMCAGEGSGIVLTNGAVIGIAVGAFAVISIIIGAVTYHIIRKEEAELVMGKKMPL